MARLRYLLRFSLRLAAGLLIAAAVLAAGSYLLGEWFVYRTEAAQQEVWSAYLNQEIRVLTAEGLGGPARPLLIVIQADTQPPHRPWAVALARPALVFSAGRPRPQAASLEAGMYARFLLANLRPHPVRPGLVLSAPYRLADSAAVAAYGLARWEALFPHNYGHFVLSAVGFNADQTEALFHVDHVCGLCGHGDDVLLRKVNGRWVIETVAGTWIS